MNVSKISYLEADQEIKHRVETEWGKKIAQYMHLSDGFSIVALDTNTLAGLISVYWKKLSPPLQVTSDAYIDIIEVRKDFRRKGIARHLIQLAAEQAKTAGFFQIRAWSSQDKIEAISMWKALRFGLCPATTFPRVRK